MHLIMEEVTWIGLVDDGLKVDWVGPIEVQYNPAFTFLFLFQIYALLALDSSHDCCPATFLILTMSVLISAPLICSLHFATIASCIVVKTS